MRNRTAPRQHSIILPFGVRISFLVPAQESKLQIDSNSMSALVGARKIFPPILELEKYIALSQSEFRLLFSNIIQRIERGRRFSNSKIW